MVSVTLSPILKRLLVLCVSGKPLQSGKQKSSPGSEGGLSSSHTSSSSVVVEEATEFLRQLGDTKLQLGLIPPPPIRTDVEAAGAAGGSVGGRGFSSGGYSAATAYLQLRLPISEEEASKLEVIGFTLVRKVALYHSVTMEAILRQEDWLQTKCKEALNKEGLIREANNSNEHLAAWEMVGTVTQYHVNGAGGGADNKKALSTRGKTLTLKLYPFCTTPPLITVPDTTASHRSSHQPNSNQINATSRRSSSSRSYQGQSALLPTNSIWLDGGSDKSVEKELRGYGEDTPVSGAVIKICTSPLGATLTAEKLATKRRLAQIEGLMEDLEYEKMISGGSHRSEAAGSGKHSIGGQKVNVVSSAAVKEALAAKHGHLFASKGSKEHVLSKGTGGTSAGGIGHGESFGVFMRDMSIGIDVRLMSLSGAVVGYYLCWSRGQGQDSCIVGAAIGAIFMMFMDAILMIIRMSREDKVLQTMQPEGNAESGGNVVKGRADMSEETKPIVLDTRGLLTSSPNTGDAAVSVAKKSITAKSSNNKENSSGKKAKKD